MNEVIEKLVEQVKDLGRKIDDVKQLVESKQNTKDFYTPQEVAEKLSKTPDTVREWCRTGRIEAVKRKGTGRGGEEEWRIPHTGLEYYWNHGLIPLQRRQHARI